MNKIFKLALAMTITINTVASAQTTDNPLLQKWDTPHQTPPFHLIKNSHYEPAIEAAIKEARANIEQIANNVAQPTWENTIVALEQASERLDLVSSVLMNLNECNTDAEMQEIVMRVMPQLTKFGNEVSMNEKLYARVKQLYDQRGQLKLSKEELTVLENSYKGFVRNGVGLTGDKKARYAANAEKIAQLQQQFTQNVLAENNAYELHVTDASQLSGLPETALAAAEQEARSRGKEGWVFTLQQPSYAPLLTYCDNRGLREKIWRAYNSRGNQGNANDNNEVIRQLTMLRREQAVLLGYRNFCDYTTSDQMAESPEKLEAFMHGLLEAALPVAKGEVEEVRAFAKETGADFELMPWDFSYYAHKMKVKRYDFDAEVLRPFFQLEKVREGIFELYGKLYGIRFEESSTIEVYHPDVKAYEVYDGKRFMGVLYLDMFPRASKGGGAWMVEFRRQSKLGGQEVRPVIQVVCNFSKPIGDRPALLSFDEVETFMHEMGHAMHGMLSDCTYPSVSGTSVKRDYVELLSQVMENWCYESEFLNTFAKHYETGDTIPGEYIEKIKAGEKYLAGYYCIRQLNFGTSDIAYHSIDKPIEGKIEDFERQHIVEILPSIEGCPFSTAFGHIFSGGYASGYYSYKWAEVLDADVYAKFKSEGIFNRKTAGRFRSEMLSKGGTQHPSVLFRNFMGRDPKQDAFMERSGFKATHK